MQDSRGYRFFWASNLCFFSGAGIQTLVMAWLTYSMTGSTFLLGMFTAANLLPQLLGPFAGIAAERMDRVRLLLGACAVCIVIGVTVTMLSLTGVLAFWHLVAAGFALGITQSTMMPVRNTMIVDLVPRAQLSAAMALNNVAQMSNAAIGPLAGGVLYRHLGVLPALGAAVGLAMAAGALLLRGGITGAPSIKSTVSPLHALIEGFQIVAKHRTMVIVLLVTFLANLFGWPAFATFMPVFAKDVLLIGADGLGTLQALFGIGALCGNFAIAALGDFRWKGQLYLWGTVGFGLFYALFALSHSYALSLGLLFLVGFSASAFGVMQSTLLLLLAPPEVRGRVMGTMMLAIGIMPISSFALGGVASHFGVQATAAVCGLAVVCCMLAVFAASPRLRQL